MLHTLLIADDREAVELLGSLVRGTGELALERVLPLAPGSYQLTIGLQTETPDLILLDYSNAAKAGATLDHICEKHPAIPVISFSMDSRKPYTPFSLEPPLTVPGLMQVVRAAMHGSVARTKENVFAILPAKAGGGATTIAINTAARLASVFGKRVLVCESDLRSGVIAELLRLQPKASMQQTLESADAAETLIWPRHVCHKDGVDFLLTRREHNEFQPRWHDYHHLLSFVSSRYDYVLFDLPELIDDATLEVVQSAKRVYLSTTPEILSLQLARERVVELRDMGVNPSGLKVVVNRRHKTDFEVRHIEELLDCAVETEFPNDYPAVHAATVANTFVDCHTALGRAYGKAAAMLANGQRPQVNRRSLFGFLRRYDESLVAQRG